MENNKFEKPNNESKEKLEAELEKFILAKLKELDFSHGLEGEAYDLIGKMEKHHRPTYLHMLRVARVSYMVSEKLNVGDGKLEFIGGLLHDIGKLEMNPKNLVQYRDISDEEYDKIKKHIFFGHKNLRDDHALTSLIVGGHHGFKKNGYGITEKDFPDFVKKDLKLKNKVIDAIKTVAIADFIDAARTRHTTERSGSNLSLEEKLKNIFPGQENKIDYLLKDSEILRIYNP